MLSAGERYLAELQIQTELARSGGILPPPVYSAADWAKAMQACIVTSPEEFGRATIHKVVDLAERTRVELFRVYPMLDRVLTPFQYWLLIKRQIAIEYACGEYGAREIARPIVGVLPSGTINAMVLCEPISNEHIILFDFGFKVFANQVAKLVVRSWLAVNEMLENDPSSFTSESIQASALDCNEIARGFADMMLKYVYEGTPVLDEPFAFEKSISNAERHLSYQVEVGMETFAIGHEYSHVILEHLEKREMAERSIGGRTVNEVLLNWTQEEEADQLGFRLMMHGTKAVSPDGVLTFCGATLFFSCMQAVERAIALAIGRSEERKYSSSHPPAVQRIQVLMLEGRRLHERTGQPNESAFVHAILFDEIVQAYSNNVLTEIRSRHANKWQVSPIWLGS